MDNKITIIEGPPPIFEAVNDDWALGLSESPQLSGLALTRVRTFNGPSLLERCYHAWQELADIYLEYRTPEGMMSQSPIVAARNVQHTDGDVLLLWVRVAEENIELEIGYDDDFGEEDDDWGFTDLP